MMIPSVLCLNLVLPNFMLKYDTNISELNFAAFKLVLEIMDVL